MCKETIWTVALGPKLAGSLHRWLNNVEERATRFRALNSKVAGLYMRVGVLILLPLLCVAHGFVGTQVMLRRDGLLEIAVAESQGRKKRRSGHNLLRGLWKTMEN
mmetsp:Transcript_20782/g.41163  ORF Transcript_20782/g.41163 Transcript_20782/m.41163 type:complete len:105 (+) Transcript_20782:142-456(+)